MPCNASAHHDLERCGMMAPKSPELGFFDFDTHDLRSIKVALSTLFPDLGTVSSIRELGRGFSSIVVETDTGVVFKIARNKEAARGHGKEARLLPRLKAALPVLVPEPQWQTGPSDGLPFGAIGYRKLAGIPLHPTHLSTSVRSRKVARTLATFLHALHSIPTSELRGVNLPRPEELLAEYVALRSDVLPALRGALTRQEYGTIVRWWDAFLSDSRLQSFRPVLQHGDFWYENILVDPETLDVTGVIDFENSAIGDPAQDFATLLYHGKKFVEEAIEAYQVAGGEVGEDFHHRVQRYWELRDFGGVRWAVRFNDAEEFEDSIQKLRKGPILLKK